MDAEHDFRFAKFGVADKLIFKLTKRAEAAEDKLRELGELASKLDVFEPNNFNLGLTYREGQIRAYVDSAKAIRKILQTDSPETSGITKG